MNAELGVAMDTPTVSWREPSARCWRPGPLEAVVGWPEKFFVRLNAILPRLVDGSLRKQLPVIRRHAWRGQSRLALLPTFNRRGHPHEPHSAHVPCRAGPAGTRSALQPCLAEFDTELLAIQTSWADANYSPDGDAREAAFDKLDGRGRGLQRPAIPVGPSRSSGRASCSAPAAGVKGGLGALGLAKESRARLEAALKIDPNALQGSAYTSLGTLYHKVPGFPVGFGSDKKATELLEKSLTINPDGIDPNYFYGEFLFDEDDYVTAREHLEKALKAAPRPESAVGGRGSSPRYPRAAGEDYRPRSADAGPAFLAESRRVARPCVPAVCGRGRYHRP